ncbi:MAG: hypothetical protein JWM73_1042 [Solirubrobacterales bacterium]|nr:hypothetical protein [Solirubrobacterales bacterium]
MSFLIDPALLYSGGRTYAAVVPDDARTPARDAALMAAYMAVFWGVSVGLYLDQGWTKPVWKACRAESGRDWMLNSGVLKLDWRKAGTGTHAVSAAIFATYPVWLWLGMRRRGAT